jgi:hypothetical protein
MREEHPPYGTIFSEDRYLLMDSASTKKPYFQPSLTQITRDQAIKVVRQRNNCGEDDAVNFLESLLRREYRNEETRKEQRPKHASSEERKRSA